MRDEWLECERFIYDQGDNVNKDGDSDIGDRSKGREKLQFTKIE